MAVNFDEVLRSYEQLFAMKNFSYEGNFHQKFYYPRLVYQRVLRRRRSSNSAGESSPSSESQTSPGAAAGSGGVGSSSLGSRTFSLSTPDFQRLEGFDADNDLYRHDSSAVDWPMALSSSRLSDSGEDFRCSSVGGGSSKSDDDNAGSSYEAPSFVVRPSVANAGGGNIGRREGREKTDDRQRAPPSLSTSSSASSTATTASALLAMISGPPLRRSSSLKLTRSTSTPALKAVRFADTMGLQLQSVKRIRHKDAPETRPVVSRAALRDLKRGLEEEHKTEGTRYLCACFTPPGSPTAAAAGFGEHFRRRVLEHKVTLETCVIGERDLTVMGTVRVANVCYRKQVVVRYTVNGWVTFDDVAAGYVLNSNDGETDRFAFAIVMPRCMAVGSRVEFAVRLAAVDVGEVFWDNNFGLNYRIECYAKAVPIRESDLTWMHFL